VTDELEGIRREGVVSYFTVLSQNFPGGSEEIHKNLG
jgi:hypothetical protein